MAACTPGQQPYLFNSATGQVTFAAASEFEAIAEASAAIDFGAGWTVSNRVFMLDDGTGVPSYSFLAVDGDENDYEITLVPSLLCDGGYVDPGGGGTTVTCSVSPCSITVHHEVQISHPLLDLTPAEGAQIAGAILAIWAIGYIFRMLRQALNSDGTTNLKED